VIQVYGTEHSDHRCLPCQSWEGLEVGISQSCALCPADEYAAGDDHFDVLNCKACPPGTYSFAGAVGSSQVRNPTPRLERPRVLRDPAP
jgi:hypothetical protein